MGGGAGSEADSNIEPVAGDEPARGGQQDGERRVARGGRRKQDAQRIALIKMVETGDAAAATEADFGGALAQYPRARPSFRGSEPPISTPRSWSIQIA